MRYQSSAKPNAHSWLDLLGGDSFFFAERKTSPLGADGVKLWHKFLGGKAMREHTYKAHVEWTGNLGTGTADYRGYSRAHLISAPGKASAIPGSSDSAFRGDASRYNPEELLVAAASSCHMLWMLHLCAVGGIVITEYSDDPVGTMQENADGSGEFTALTLHPRLVITDAARIEDTNSLHARAHEMCFIARSLRCEVKIQPTTSPASI